MTNEQRVLFFEEGQAKGPGWAKRIQKGTRVGLAEMTNLGLPVPPGLTISTDACMAYLAERRQGLPPGLWEEISRSMARLEAAMNRRFGDAANPLLVSVRSSVAHLMPGMMDSVLNLGLNDRTVQGLIARTQNERFGYGIHRRFIATFAHIVLGVPLVRFEQVLDGKKAEAGVEQEAALTVKDLKELIEQYQALVQSETGRAFPSDPYEQLQRSVLAVLDSWMGPRAVEYRRLRQMSNSEGTGVDIVAMVFGNLGETSGIGVTFTRNPSTGTPGLYGEFLLNAQADDVVIGIRTLQPIEKLGGILPEAYRALLVSADTLETQYRDMFDLEFTIENGRLYLLQARIGKRTALAAVRITVDLAREGRITVRDAVMRVEPNHLSHFLFPVFDEQDRERRRLLARGLPVGPGHASGRLAFTSNTASEMQRRGERVILVCPETSPEDIHGIHAAVGLLTAKGDRISHAAVVSRQLGKVCVVGCDAIDIGADGTVRIGPAVLREGEAVSVNGFSGEVYQGEIPVTDSEVVQVLQGQLSAAQSEAFRYYATFMEWVGEHQGLQVRANADLPDQAHIARLFGADGIGLYRTESMFSTADRIPILLQIIMAETKDEVTHALNQLLPMQKQDFIELYREMHGKPVSIRLLDPPFDPPHHYLPRRQQLKRSIAEIELTGEHPVLVRAQRVVLTRMEELIKTNPLFGLREHRLGFIHPDVTRMQVQAIMEAACEVRAEGIDVVPEIMVPLVAVGPNFAVVAAMTAQKALIAAATEETMTRYAMRFPYRVGAMFELCTNLACAEQLAESADFFLFGSNELMQGILGGYLQISGHTYLDPPITGIMPDELFVTLKGVEELGGPVEAAANKGRRTKPALKLGLCGEHGGDPASVAFCHQLGLDYVSCSPYRIPIARLAAAQAAIAARSVRSETTTMT